MFGLRVKWGGFDATSCTRLLLSKSPMRNFTSRRDPQIGRCNRGPNGHAHASDGIGYTPYSANFATSCTCSTGSIDWSSAAQRRARLAHAVAWQHPLYSSQLFLVRCSYAVPTLFPGSVKVERAGTHINTLDVHFRGTLHGWKGNLPSWKLSVDHHDPPGVDSRLLHVKLAQQ